MEQTGTPTVKPPRSRSNASLTSVRVDRGSSTSSGAGGEKGAYGGPEVSSRFRRDLHSRAADISRRLRNHPLASVALLVAVLVLWAFFSLSTSSPFSLGHRDTAQGLSTKYALVIDAGSTGSRIHIFEFNMDRRGNLDLQKVSSHGPAHALRRSPSKALPPALTPSHAYL